MADRKYRLEWVPMGKSRHIQVPYTLNKDSLKLVYKLDPDLPFGHLELNGVDITGYFKPDNGDMEYTCRPWMFSEEQDEPEPETDEPEPEAE